MYRDKQKQWFEVFLMLIIPERLITLNKLLFQDKKYSIAAQLQETYSRNHILMEAHYKRCS